MGSVAYKVTKDVRHLAPWTQNTQQDDVWPTGTFRPICGRKVEGPNTELLWPGLVYEDQLFAEQSHKKPVCLDCVKVLRRLTELAEVTQ